MKQIYNDWIPRETETKRQTDTHTHTDGQTDTDGRTDGQTDRQIWPLSVWNDFQFDGTMSKSMCVYVLWKWGGIQLAHCIACTCNYCGFGLTTLNVNRSSYLKDSAVIQVAMFCWPSNLVVWSLETRLETCDSRFLRIEDQDARDCQLRFEQYYNIEGKRDNLPPFCIFSTGTGGQAHWIALVTNAISILVFYTFKSWLIEPWWLWSWTKQLLSLGCIYRSSLIRATFKTGKLFTFF